MPIAAPLFAYFASQWGGMLAGSFVIEIIFNRPGLGSLLVDSILARDYTVVEAALFFSAAFALLGTWAGDTLLVLIDPREKRI